MEDKEEPTGEIVAIRTPRLDPLEKLYVRTYLSTHSHPKAHSAVTPNLKNPKEDNPYSRRDNVQFHISLALQERAESLLITPDLIVEKLYKEAIREGAGSNHAARIQALTQLGKHFGMFQEKKEDTTPIFNIINYSSEPIKIEHIEEKKTEEILLPDNIILENYS
jgi:hypothetical protein